MICNIFKINAPSISVRSTELITSSSNVVCQDWEINEYGDTTNCELTQNISDSWDSTKLGRLKIGKDRGISIRKITGLEPNTQYRIYISLRALQIESIPFFTERYNLIVNIEGVIIKISSNEPELENAEIYASSDEKGGIKLSLSSTSANFQVDSILGFCE